MTFDLSALKKAAITAPQESKENIVEQIFVPPNPPPAITQTSLSTEEVELLTAFRVNLNHLSASLENPKYELKVSDAIRAVGEIIRSNPNLASILEPEDFRLIVRNTRMSAAHRATTTNATQVKREKKASMVADAEKLLDDALAGSLGGSLTGLEKKPAKTAAISGADLQGLLTGMGKGSTLNPTASPSMSAPKITLGSLFGKKKEI